MDIQSHVTAYWYERLARTHPPLGLEGRVVDVGVGKLIPPRDRLPAPKTLKGIIFDVSHDNSMAADKPGCGQGCGLSKGRRRGLLILVRWLILPQEKIK